MGLDLCVKFVKIFNKYPRWFSNQTNLGNCPSLKDEELLKFVAWDKQYWQYCILIFNWSGANKLCLHFYKRGSGEEEWDIQDYWWNSSSSVLQAETWQIAIVASWCLSLDSARREGWGPHIMVCRAIPQRGHPPPTLDKRERNVAVCCYYIHCSPSNTLGNFKNFLERQDIFKTSLTFEKAVSSLNGHWTLLTEYSHKIRVEGSNPGWTSETPYILSRNFLEQSPLSAQDIPGSCCQ